MKTELTKEFLIQEYVVKGKTACQIAEEAGVHHGRIYRRLTKFGIPRRKPMYDYSILPSRKFGKLTVVEILGTDKSRRRMWKCQCECGNFSKHRAGDVASGRITDCGRCNWWGDIPYCVWTAYKQNPHNYEFTISEEYVKNKFNEQNGKCALSSVKLCFAKSQKERWSQTTASLDRIDSSKGYIEGNVQWVHKTINNMKQQLSDDEFIDWCKKVAECQKS